MIENISLSDLKTSRAISPLLESLSFNFGVSPTNTYVLNPAYIYSSYLLVFKRTSGGLADLLVTLNQPGTILSDNINQLMLVSPSAAEIEFNSSTSVVLNPADPTFLSISIYSSKSEIMTLDVYGVLADYKSIESAGLIRTLLAEISSKTPALESGSVPVIMESNSTTLNATTLITNPAITTDVISLLKFLVLKQSIKEVVLPALTAPGIIGPVDMEVYTKAAITVKTVGIDVSISIRIEVSNVGGSNQDDWDIAHVTNTPTTINTNGTVAFTFDGAFKFIRFNWLSDAGVSSKTVSVIFRLSN